MADRHFDLGSDVMVVDPYPVYRRLLKDHPIYWCEHTHCWYVSRYQDFVSVLKDSRFSSNRVPGMVAQLPDPQRQAISPLIDALSRWVLFRDPPDHTPFRKAIVKAFTLRLIKQMHSRIQTLADDLVDGIYDQGHLDVINDIAYPLPAIIIAEMLGAPPEDRDAFKQWSDDIALFLGAKPTVDSMEKAQESVHEMTDYFRFLLKKQRQAPRENLMQSLITVRNEDHRFTDADLLANCILLVFAGHETTTNLIGNGLLALLKHPGQCNALLENPTLIDAAIEECLRYDSPVQRFGRIAQESVKLDGEQVEKGYRIYVLVGAANHDPRVFDLPDRFDIARNDDRHRYHVAKTQRHDSRKHSPAMAKELEPSRHEDHAGDIFSLNLPWRYLFASFLRSSVIAVKLRRISFSRVHSMRPQKLGRNNIGA